MARAIRELRSWAGVALLLSSAYMVGQIACDPEPVCATDWECAAYRGDDPDCDGGSEPTSR